MKSISDSDFSLIVTKLPIALALARKAVASSDTRTANTIRMLSRITIKWQKKYKPKNIIQR